MYISCTGFLAIAVQRLKMIDFRQPFAASQRIRKRIKEVLARHSRHHGASISATKHSYGYVKHLRPSPAEQGSPFKDLNIVFYLLFSMINPDCQPADIPAGYYDISN
jgi:hypothetical protein